VVGPVATAAGSGLFTASEAAILADAIVSSGKSEASWLGGWRNWDVRVHLVALAAACTLPSLALAVFATAALADTASGAGAVLVTGAVLVIGGIGAAAIIGQRISRSLAALSSAARRLTTLEPAPAIQSSPIREVREAAAALEFAARRLGAHDRQLRRTQEHLTRAQAVAAIGSFEHDGAKAVSRWSPETYVILGHKPKMLTPSEDNFFACIVEEDRPRLQQFIAGLHRGEEPAAVEVRIRRPNGAMRVGHFEAQPVCDGQGAAAGYIGTLQDVTDRHDREEARRELELELRHSQKLEALGTLAGGIAHDLNNTLVPVLSLTKLVRNKLPAGSRERANLDTVLTAGSRARDLVAQVLAFSRKEKTDKRSVDLAEIVTESLKMLRASLPSTIRLESQISAGLPISCDPSQVHQIIINLITNAAHAIGAEPGMIAVGLDRVLSTSGSPPRVRLTVADSGCGMDEVTRRRIFEPFFTTKPVGEGTGLGLSVVYGIVATYGGTIDVKSEVGAGTQFELTFPLAVDEPSDGVPAEQV